MLEVRSLPLQVRTQRLQRCESPQWNDDKWQSRGHLLDRAIIADVRGADAKDPRDGVPVVNLAKDGLDLVHFPE